MDMDMDMDMSMNMGGLGTGGTPSFGATSRDLGFRPITLQFPLGGAPPAFPIDLLPTAKWAWNPASWDGGLESYLALIQFIGTTWTTINFDALRQWDPTLPGNTPQGCKTFVQAEIQQLQDLMRQERERYLPEILSQHDGAPAYWMSLMEITNRTKPKTCRLMSIAGRIGECAVVYFKNLFARPRASQICPGLFPPFGPPGHPSFPSGHATQGHLLSLCLEAATFDPVTGVSDYAAQLDWLADRVALNRERAGFHYRSDSDAGRYLAQQVFEILNDPKQGCTVFQGALGDAVGEW